MKKATLFFMATTFISVACSAQNINPAKVPSPVKSAFAKAHASVTKVNWETEGGNYEAGFKLDGKQTSAVYTPKGILVETEVQIKATELPAAVLAQLKGKKVTETAKITKADGTVIYEAEVKGKDLLFDLKGNLIKP